MVEQAQPTKTKSGDDGWLFSSTLGDPSVNRILSCEDNGVVVIQHVLT